MEDLSTAKMIETFKTFITACQFAIEMPEAFRKKWHIFSYYLNIYPLHSHKLIEYSVKCADPELESKFIEENLLKITVQDNKQISTVEKTESNISNGNSQVRFEKTPTQEILSNPRSSQIKPFQATMDQITNTRQPAHKPQTDRPTNYSDSNKFRSPLKLVNHESETLKGLQKSNNFNVSLSPHSKPLSTIIPTPEKPMDIPPKLVDPPIKPKEVMTKMRKNVQVCIRDAVNKARRNTAYLLDKLPKHKYNKEPLNVNESCISVAANDTVQKVEAHQLRQRILVLKEKDQKEYEQQIKQYQYMLQNPQLGYQNQYYHIILPGKPIQKNQYYSYK